MRRARRAPRRSAGAQRPGGPAALASRRLRDGRGAQAASSAAKSAGSGDSHCIGAPRDRMHEAAAAARAAPAARTRASRRAVARRAPPRYVGIADQRMPERGEVHADLVRAPGLEPAARRASRRRSARRPRRACAPACRAATTAIDVRCVGWRPIGASTVVAAREVAVHERQVLARARVRAASWRTRSVCASASWRRPGGRSCPCRGDGRCRRAAARRAAGAWCSSAFSSVPSRLPLPGCTTSPAGLSTTSERVVLVARSASAIACAASARRRRPASLGARRAPRRRASLWRGDVDHGAVDADAAGLDPALEAACASAAAGAARASGRGGGPARAGAGRVERGARGRRRAVRRRHGRGVIIRSRRSDRMQVAIAMLALGPAARSRRALLAALRRARARGLRPVSRGEGRDRRLVGGSPLPDRARSDGARAIIRGRSSSSRQLEARFPYGRYAQQAILESAYANWRAQRDGGGDRRVRPLHPHVSQPSERRLRVLPEGPRPLPRGPGTARLRVRARPLRARSEGDARVVRGVQGADAPSSRTASTTQDSRRAHALPRPTRWRRTRCNVASYYYKRGAYVAAANRAQARARQLSRRRRPTRRRSTCCARATTKLGMPQLADDSQQHPRARPIRTAATSRGVTRHAVVEVLVGRRRRRGSCGPVAGRAGRSLAGEARDRGSRALALGSCARGRSLTADCERAGTRPRRATSRVRRIGGRLCQMRLP